MHIKCYLKAKGIVVQLALSYRVQIYPPNLSNYIYIYIVGIRFAAQTQTVWDLGLVNPVQEIYKELVKELSFSELDNG